MHKVWPLENENKWHLSFVNILLMNTFMDGKRTGASAIHFQVWLEAMEIQRVSMPGTRGSSQKISAFLWMNFFQNSLSLLNTFLSVSIQLSILSLTQTNCQLIKSRPHKKLCWTNITRKKMNVFISNHI